MKFILVLMTIINIVLVKRVLSLTEEMTVRKNEYSCVATGQNELGRFLKSSDYTRDEVWSFLVKQQELGQPKKYCADYTPFWAGFLVDVE